MLLAGTTRSLLSRQQYEKVRNVMRLCEVDLPEWGSMRDMRERLKKRLGINVIESKSPLDNPCYGLSVREVLGQVSSVWFNILQVKRLLKLRSFYQGDW